MGIIDAIFAVFVLATARVLWACYLAIRVYIPVVDRWCEARIRERYRTMNYDPPGTAWIHEAYDAIDVDGVILQALARPWSWHPDKLIPPKHRSRWLQMKEEA